MMNIILIGDLHIDSKIGSIFARDLIEEKKDKLLELINKEDMVIFMGDYFNVPEPSNKFRHFFSDFLKKIKQIEIILKIFNFLDVTGGVYKV